MRGAGIPTHGAADNSVDAHNSANFVIGERARGTMVRQFAKIRASGTGICLRT